MALKICCVPVTVEQQQSITQKAEGTPSAQPESLPETEKEERPRKEKKPSALMRSRGSRRSVRDYSGFSSSLLGTQSFLAMFEESSVLVTNDFQSVRTPLPSPKVFSSPYSQPAAQFPRLVQPAMIF